MTPVLIFQQATTDGLSLTLSQAGTIKVKGDQAAVTRWLPTISEHKPELLALLAANEDENQEVILEAAEERAAILEYDGGLPGAQAIVIADLFKAFYGHLMGIGKKTNCCHAPVNRYCPEGKRLRDAYYEACS